MVTEKPCSTCNAASDNVCSIFPIFEAQEEGVKKTEKNILQSALTLFNQNGLVNVRLQQIANQSGISIGNLAYHYASKQAIVETIQKQIATIIEPLLSEKKTFPNLIDINNQLSVYYDIIGTYSFYFSDLLEIERAYPQIHALSINHLNQLIHQIKDWLICNEKAGALQSELFDRQFDYLAHNIWTTIQFWNAQAIIRGVEIENEGRFKSVIWSLIKPYFTEIGQSEYEILILPQIINFSS